MVGWLIGCLDRNGISAKRHTRRQRVKGVLKVFTSHVLLVSIAAFGQPAIMMVFRRLKVLFTGRTETCRYAGLTAFICGKEREMDVERANICAPRVCIHMRACLCVRACAYVCIRRYAFPLPDRS